MNQADPKDERIEPIDFHSSGGYRRFWSKQLIGWTAGAGAVLILFFLCAGAWFVFTARQVAIRIEPVPEKISVKGGLLAPRVGTHFLMRPGEYELTAGKTCYRELEHLFRVGSEKRQQVDLSMQKLPGKLEVNAHQADQPQQAIVDASIRIDGIEIGRTPLTPYEVDAGNHRLEISAQNYKTLEREIVVEGCNQLQKLDLALIPGWSNLTIGSVPSGATLEIDGEAVGQTPLRLDLKEGPYELVLKADGYKPWLRRIEMTANQPMDIPAVELVPADGRLTITTTPAGANVEIDDHDIGQTPLTADIAPNKEHALTVSKKGFRPAKRTVQLKSGEAKTLKVTLARQTGKVLLEVTPQGSELYIDGVKKALSTRPITLSADEHELEIRKQGYETSRRRILPQPGKTLSLRIELKSIDPAGATAPARIKAPNGYSLVRIDQGEFMMGSSRREQGRRSNETLRAVVLTRPFYIGTREVTNQEFRQFQADHQSGIFKGQNLDSDDLPVVQISWEQAALFCNWLSEKASLPPVYKEKNGRLTASDPIGTGYRLPTEAEWEYTARYDGGSTAGARKFPWGNGFPPLKASGNFADAAAKNVLTTYLETYEDGYPVAAPTGKFKANRLGMFDMGGNAAEWCHDYYDISSVGRKDINPAGPEDGRHHVIRGSSWKDGTLSALRLAYRDYSDTKRPDLGFRVARYAK